jgi:plastocyanin
MKNRGVLLTVLTMMLMAGGLHTAGGAEVNVEVRNNFFDPAEVVIQPGDTVTWTNVGRGLHNVRADDGSFRCANGCDATGGNGNPSAAGWSVSLTFNEAGEIPYNCEIHVGVGMRGTVIVQAQQADAGSLQFDMGNYDLSEDAGNASVNVVRDGGTDGAVTVDVATSDGSAGAGSDYTSSSATLAWGSGEGGAKSFDVAIIDDAQDEGSETVNLGLSDPTGEASLGSPSAATITILDNDGDTTPCVQSADTLCLVGERFRVEVSFRRAEGQDLQPAVAIPFTDRAGLFHFGNENNIEMLIKVLRACSLTGFKNFWVFFAATTDSEFVVTVTDTESGETKQYSNPLGMAALPVTDTAAFDTCP